MSKSYEEILEERFDCDPFFTILVDFERKYNNNKDIKVIDVFIGAGIKILKIKYTKCTTENKMIVWLINILETDKYKGLDGTIKVFVLLFLIQWEPEMALCIEQCYNTSGGMFEDKGPICFRKTMVSVNQYIEMTLNFEYNIINIVEIVDNFVSTTREKYILG